MVRIFEETIVITLNQLAKGNVDPESAVNDEILATLESVVQELVAEKVVVDVIHEVK